MNTNGTLAGGRPDNEIEDNPPIKVRSVCPARQCTLSHNLSFHWFCPQNFSTLINQKPLSVTSDNFMAQMVKIFFILTFLFLIFLGEIRN